MCALGHYLELAGIATTGISLVRENAQALQPPRSLWVPFPLGRPMGSPHNKRFQHKVLSAALDLLKRDRGPVLEDFSEDAPEGVSRSVAAICPVSFSPKVGDNWHGRLTHEISTLAPWYAIGLERRAHRTLFGLSETSVEDIAARLGDYLDRDQLPTDSLKWFKRAIDDLKAFYLEALTAQPGHHDPLKVNRTIWHETAFGQALRVFYDGLEKQPELKNFARIVLPREAVHGQADRQQPIETDP